MVLEGRPRSQRTPLVALVTFVTRGRGHQRAAAIVPAELVERFEAMVDAEEGRIAAERLADLGAGRTTAIPAGEVGRALGL